MQNSQAIQAPDKTRAAMLAAARAVAERDGVENLTFGKVAAEAGVPRSAVTAQFGRREDLLMSIVSEDLASLAHGLDETAAETPEPSLETLLENAAPQPAEAPKDAPARQKLARRGELAQLIEARAESAEPARTPDAWLERRLRVFERAMTAMETRQAEVEKNSRAAVSAAEEGVKALEATVRELKERADAADARAKAAANEVRTALNETSLRLQTVEGVARAALAENKSVAGIEAGPDAAPAAEHAEDVAQTVAAETAPHVEPAPAVDADAAPAETEPKSFIAGVRKSVVAATAAAQAAQAEPKTKPKRSSLLRLLLSSGLVLVVFVAAAGMAFSKGVSDGRREAMHQVVRVPAATATRLAATQTPLDQLTARARGGNPAAELAVARRYLETSHRDPAAALHWTSLAAVHGQAVAQYLLGTLYASGTGTAADPARALQWYEAAALQGNRKAMHALAVAYAEGLGTAKSPSESVRWFARAAGFGYVDAQFNLAVLYERGLGVPQSLLDAYKWYAVAGRAGDAEARVRLEALRTQLNSDDLAAAQSAANAFRATAYDVAAN